MDALEPYLAELRDIRASGGGGAETSGYGALATLLNEIGHHLKPKVHCFINLTNTGAGIPDGGLFVANQIQRARSRCPASCRSAAPSRSRRRAPMPARSRAASRSRST